MCRMIFSTVRTELLTLTEKTMKYHYEWAAYTDNMCWGRQLIAHSKSLKWVRHVAGNSNKGAYIIVKQRVYDV